MKYIKGKFVILVLILAILSISCVSASVDDGNRTNMTELNVSSAGPTDLNKIIHEIRSNQYYKGYNNDTVNWMESLGSKGVFSSPDALIVMDWDDAKKLPSEHVTDLYIEIFIKCEVVGNHSLGNGTVFKDVLEVKNVTYQGKEIHDLRSK